MILFEDGQVTTITFNKKYKCIGHLWQDRYKSWFVTDEAYLYTLMRYIEQNPLKAGIVNDLSNYHFSSFSYSTKLLDKQELWEKY